MLKKYRVTVNGQTYDVGVEEMGGSSAPASAPVASASAPVATAPAPVATPTPVAGGASGAGTIKAPMPGTVLSVKVSAGQLVKRGAVLLILEAMKMENEICAQGDGTVTQIRVQAGTTVNTGDPMIDIV